METEIAEQRVVYLNRMAQLLFGYDAEDVRAGLPGKALFAEDQFEEVLRALARYVAPSIEKGVRYVKSGRQELLEFRMKRKDGSTFTAETQSSFVLDASGIPRRMRSIVRDMTARKELERRLEELSHRDPLTGCYNRRHLEAARSDLERPTARWACLVFDLDGFKAINDTYGHEEGDRVLRGFAHFVGRQHRADDILVRTGGDEFALIVRADSEAEADGVSARLLEAAGPRQPRGLQHGQGLQATRGRAGRGPGTSRPHDVRRPRTAFAPDERFGGHAGADLRRLSRLASLSGRRASGT